ncbi:hypothetical protein BGZ67_001317, partial [Mortierella alpina]
LEFCIQTLQTFDPMELRNGIVIDRGLSVAKLLGYRIVMTGAGADELFAGYSFLHSMSAKRLQAYSDKLAKIMRFSGVQLAKALGLQLVQPKKEPIEVGSGMTVLPKMFQEYMSAEDLKEQQDLIFG